MWHIAPGRPTWRSKNNTIEFQQIMVFAESTRGTFTLALRRPGVLRGRRRITAHLFFSYTYLKILLLLSYPVL
jgi:hypothetical protein